jgi:hypothetical protein
MPKCVRWNFIDHYWKEDGWQDRIKKHLWSFAYNENVQRSEFIIPNPFCVEMATDFLSELMDIKATEAERKKDDGSLAPPGGIADILELLKTENELKELRKLADDVQAEWDEEEKENRNGGIIRPERGNLADGVREMPYDGPAGGKTKQKAIDLMYHIAHKCGFAIIWDGYYLLKDGSMLKPEEITPDNKRRIFLKTWLRPGKWVGAKGKKVKAPTTQDLNEGKYKEPDFDGACVDRAFYKSCNMMALQTMAWSVFRRE